MAKPGSTAKRLVVDYGELNKKTLNHSGSIPNMQSTLEKIASCRYKNKMDKRSGFWQVGLTPSALELLAFITPQGRLFKWKVMPFGVANAPALFQELMNKILSILRRRPKVQELISRGAQMEAHIDDVCLGTNTQEDHLILLGEFYAVCQENHTRLKLEKCEFMQETMQYLGTFDFTGQKVAKTMNVPPTGSIDLALKVLSTSLSAVPIFCVFVLLLHCYCRC